MKGYINIEKIKESFESMDDAQLEAKMNELVGNAVILQATMEANATSEVILEMAEVFAQIGVMTQMDEE